MQKLYEMFHCLVKLMILKVFHSNFVLLKLKALLTDYCSSLILELFFEHLYVHIIRCSFEHNRFRILLKICWYDRVKPVLKGHCFKGPPSLAAAILGSLDTMQVLWGNLP